MIMTVYLYRSYFDTNYEYIQATGDLSELGEENYDNQKLIIYKIISKSVSRIFHFPNSER